MSVSVVAASAYAEDRASDLKGKLGTIGRSIVLDGSCITNAGNLQMNITNFGFLGSLPKSSYQMADSPSAEWPAGSGIEYLYAAGLWVGAAVEGIPSVSTGYPETEFYPPDDPIDHVYRAVEGVLGGRTYPANPDDDGDSLINEDWLNGRDDDGDGLIDEDFAEIGKLMYSCWFTDDQPVAQKAWPEHTPLHLKVRQETYQWSEDGFNDFVGVHYEIINQGGKYLQNIYAGIYADLDAGPRDMPNYYKDDQIGWWSGIWCANTNGIQIPERFHTVYVYDNDGDKGRTKGYFGVVLLGSSLDAPGWSSRPRSIRIFTGLLPYDRGGEPVDDYERYECMSGGVWQAPTTDPNDYKVLMSMGPFQGLMPGESIQLDVAFVAGEGLGDFLNNAAMAKLVYNGVWIDRDKRPETGMDGRETPVVGPLKQFDPDPCDAVVQNLKVNKGDTVWANMDCGEEQELWNYPGCYKGSMLFTQSQTGINGREYQVHWITSTVTPPPNMRAVPGDAQVSLIWDNLSELTPDPVTRTIDFEGYQVWRADDWHRPIGTTVASGPSADLWHLLDSRDLVNSIEPNRDLRKPWALGGYEYEPLQQVKSREALLKAFEQNLYYDPLTKVPCPPGITEAERDTFEALARWNLGFDGGRHYYMYVDREVKNGLPYFYSVVAYEPLYVNGKPVGVGRMDTPYSNFTYTVPRSESQEPAAFAKKGVYVVPNPVTHKAIAPWNLDPNNADPSGEKVEFRNLPKCASTLRIYTLAGDLVQTLRHDGTLGDGTVAWNLVSRNGQTVTSGVYLFAVEPDDGHFSRFIGKFVVIW